MKQVEGDASVQAWHSAQPGRGGCSAPRRVGVRKAQQPSEGTSPSLSLPFYPAHFWFLSATMGKSFQATQHANAAHEGSLKGSHPSRMVSASRYELSFWFAFKLLGKRNNKGKKQTINPGSGSSPCSAAQLNPQQIQAERVWFALA